MDDSDERQERLPLGIGAEPVPFELTAKARRAVAPDTLPDLSVVDADDRPAGAGPAPGAATDPDGADDTHRARARALRRAGLDWPAIADELDADVLLVRAWVDGVAPVHSARDRARGAVPSAPAEAGAGDRRPARGPSDGGAAGPGRVHDRHRTQGRAEADRRLADDPAFAAGLGLLVGAAEVGRHAVALTGRDPDAAAAALAWLRSVADPDPGRIRVVLRLAPAVAGDRAARRWAGALDVAVERIRTTRWSAAPTADATAALVRVADPALAGRVAGWREALLSSSGTSPGTGPRGGAPGPPDAPEPPDAPDSADAPDRPAVGA